MKREKIKVSYISKTGDRITRFVFVRPDMTKKEKIKYCVDKVVGLSRRGVVDVYI